MTKWKDMTDEQKARKREKSRRYRSTPRAKALAYERRKRWNEANREKKKEQAAAWYAANRERMLERNRVWRETHKEHKRELDRAWREKHPDYQKERYARIRTDDVAMADLRAVQATWRETHREHVRKYGREYSKAYRKTAKFRQGSASRNQAEQQRRRLLFATNVAAYQRELQRQRDYTRRKAEAEGRIYRPLLSKRKPSWAVYGIDSYLYGRAPFVRYNHDATRLREFDGYARDLAISRREQMTK